MPLTPDFDYVTLKWGGLHLDGTPSVGSLVLEYSGGPQLDDSATMPVTVYPSKIETTITASTHAIPKDSGTPGETVSVEIGYVEWHVPASNDPDITGSGGTYKLTENLTKGGGRVRVFVADKDAPGGVIWLNKLPYGGQEVPGQPLSVVYYSDFNALDARVEELELDGGGGGVTSYNDLTDKPAIPTVPGDIGAQPAGSYAASSRQVNAGTGLTGGGDLTANRTLSVAYGTTSTTAARGDDARLSDARPPTTHNHVANDISNASTVGKAVLTAADAAAGRTAIGAGTSNLAVGTTATDAKAGNWTPGLAHLPAGTTISRRYVSGAWEARGTTRTDLTCLYMAATSSDPNPGDFVAGSDYLFKPLT